MSMGKVNSDNIYIRSFKKAQEITGLMQKDIAEKMGVNPSAISQYASGLRDPGLKFMERVAEAFGYDVVDFLALGRER